MSKPLCFVLMPFGKKTDASGETVDFDAVYREIIAPAIEEAGLESLRADEEMAGALIHKPMYERLILCEYAIVDLTTANANVFYELGLRHAVRRHSTVLIFADSGRLPFDVTPLRAVPYQLGPDGRLKDSASAKEALAKRLLVARQEVTSDPSGATDSPLYLLVEDYPDVSHWKTDVFRGRVRYSTELKKRLAVGRKSGLEALRNIEQDLGNIKDQESGVVIDLFLSYRAVMAWDYMIALVDKMARPLAQSVMVLEQKAWALNRAGQSEEAERILTELLELRGPSSETLGVLGRVYKDRWEQAVLRGEEDLARTLLDKAIDAYLRGFEVDWRDAYPGINAVALMELRDPPDSRRNRLVPIVSYAVEQRIAKSQPDYWDHATLLELAVLANDQIRAMELTGPTLLAVREAWEPKTTAQNLRTIREAREKRNEEVGWLKEIEDALLASKPVSFSPA